MEKGALESRSSRSLREALDLPPDLYNTEEVVLGAVSDLEQRTSCVGVFDIG